MSNPHGGAEIHVNETDLHFGDTFTVSYTEPNHLNGVLAITMQCFQEGVVVGSAGGYPIPDEFHAGPSQAWTEGAAHGVMTLYEYSNGRMKSLATDEFEVAA
jgi:hypothetical protein